MTIKEKVKADHPDWTEEKIAVVFENDCPNLYGYSDPDNDWCVNYRCRDCWNREISEAYLKARKMKVLCISGKAQHGKDTTANYLKEFMEEQGQSVLVAHYGDLVKYICKTFFDWNGQKDEKGRTLLQEVGTDTIRAKTPDFWVKFVTDILDHFPTKWEWVLIPDCRFPNEVNYLKNAGYDVFHIRVIRSNFESPLTLEQQQHISETALDHVKADLYLLNPSTLEYYRELVREVGSVLIRGDVDI